MKKFVAVIAILGTFALGACGGDDDPDPGVVDFLMEEGETRAAAECFAKELSKYSLSDFESIIELEGDVDPEFEADIAKAAEGDCVDL